MTIALVPQDDLLPRLQRDFGRELYRLAMSCRRARLSRRQDDEVATRRRDESARRVVGARRRARVRRSSSSCSTRKRARGRASRGAPSRGAAGAGRSRRRHSISARSGTTKSMAGSSSRKTSGVFPVASRPGKTTRRFSTYSSRAWPRSSVFYSSALSLAWVLVVISPQIVSPADAAHRRLGDLPRQADQRPLGAGDRHALGDCRTHRDCGWPTRQRRSLSGIAPRIPTGGDVLAGVLAIVVILEAARRTTGWILPVSAAVFLAYAFAGPWLASIGLTGIAHRGYDLPRLDRQSLHDARGHLRRAARRRGHVHHLVQPVRRRARTIGRGPVLPRFLDVRVVAAAIRRAAAGRSVTLAGFLLGTVSGSGVATTVTLGSVAWPVLRRVGFAADTAGAMLAASGIGALLSPPTLGAAAFLIAEYLRISYLQVLVMATIPTLLYYLSILLMIEGDAGRAYRRYRAGRLAPHRAPRSPSTSSTTASCTFISRPSSSSRS